MYGNFLIKPEKMREHEQWRFLESLSYLKYAYLSLVVNELEGREFSCTEAEEASANCFATGEAVMRSRGYDVYSPSFLLGLLCLLIVSFRVIAYSFLRKIKE